MKKMNLPSCSRPGFLDLPAWSLVHERPLFGTPAWILVRIVLFVGQYPGPVGLESRSLVMAMYSWTRWSTRSKMRPRGASRSTFSRKTYPCHREKFWKFHVVRHTLLVYCTIVEFWQPETVVTVREGAIENGYNRKSQIQLRRVTVGSWRGCLSALLGQRRVTPFSDKHNACAFPKARRPFGSNNARVLTSSDISS